MGIASAGNRMTCSVECKIWIAVQFLLDSEEGSRRWTCYSRYIDIRQVIRDFPHPSTIAESAPLTEGANPGGGFAYALTAACPFGICYPCQARGNTTAHSSMLLCYKIGMIAGEEIVSGGDTE